MIEHYIEKITARYETGISTEHAFRGDLQNLLESLAKDVPVINDPARIDCGAPDYIITKQNIPIGYIEAKDIGAKFYEDVDDRIGWIRNALADIIESADMPAISNNFGKSTRFEDPIIHDYEKFLAEYNPELRKSRGVWYTPEPIVGFIVRAVDDILKTEFGLHNGLAGNVRILDPAAGTGTFLAEVVRQIYEKFENQQGVWSSYVENHLIPRLNGFEILMAPYAIAHLKLELLLRETGYVSEPRKRLRIFLTNSLGEARHHAGTLFARWLSQEATEANTIKQDTPVMVVIGNPPYSVSSVNRGEWIRGLIKDYKKDLNEKKINLDDDYIKFIRYGQYFIEKNGSGVLAYISNNSFIDGITHRQMRKHLSETFDKIYILDLHGNANKREAAPDGGKDENVFDIMQGVSINLFIKNHRKRKRRLAEVFHHELFGKRDAKYDFLSEKNLKTVNWQKLRYEKPYFFFVPKDFGLEDKWNAMFSIGDLMENKSGIMTQRDDFVTDFDKDILEKRMLDYFSSSSDEVRLCHKFKIHDFRNFKVAGYRKNHVYDKSSIKKILFRPFDQRFVYYQKTIVQQWQYDISHHLLKNNVALVFMRQVALKNSPHSHLFISDMLVDHRCMLSNRGYANIAPLYLYPDDDRQNGMDDKPRRPNLDVKIVRQIAERIGLTFTDEKEESENTFAPIDILDYIYAVLHSPAYRQKYEEFLKTDFPRVPHPESAEIFWQLAALGGELRRFHLLEHPKTERYITAYPKDGNNMVVNVRYEVGKVWINEEQYFDKVPQIAWEFHVGGYQPAQKWLKDRKGRTLTFEDILHYQKIVVALTETDKIMKKIDKTEFAEGMI